MKPANSVFMKAADYNSPDCQERKRWKRSGQPAYEGRSELSPGQGSRRLEAAGCRLGWEASAQERGPSRTLPTGLSIA